MSNTQYGKRGYPASEKRANERSESAVAGLASMYGHLFKDNKKTTTKKPATKKK